MMKYLNILIIIIMLAIGTAPLLTAEDQAATGYIQAESSIDCHCEHHQELQKNKVYIIDCDTADKLTAKSHIQARIISVSQVLNSNSQIIYYIFPPFMTMADSLSAMVDTPPPKVA